ncbi:serine/threonine-protein phosphatase [Pseudenhygromyxa sp. WMMC2535]|uniref:PP2C family protein-serine/threonine phosphatase n=1 Tax=Pseudenhygromyxa sp. WMMC2535 TaxID=2712867 RepID=UPI0015549A6E|nr:protein phosphatase 2C domain-containing protein [Pseudenhygromyxa sp. WMMC2535]NVB38823.1 serine/threonine-protein phosphatase [Pseudenhygromyxa sp. WMMC2535]
MTRTLHAHAHAHTTTGRRSQNEDAFLLEDQLGVFAVLDGMGGYAGGALASNLAVQTIAHFFQVVTQNPDATWPYALDPHKSLAENQVEAALRLANRQIRAKRCDQYANMGSTVVLLAVQGDHAVLAHLGDSRIYRLRGDVISRLTCDHSLYEHLRAAGVELPSEAEFPHANVITRALGPHEDERPELARVDLKAGDRYLLCTDGLCGVLSDEEIAALLAEGSVDAACVSLVDTAYALGSRDNITALVLELA